MDTDPEIRNNLNVIAMWQIWIHGVKKLLKKNYSMLMTSGKMNHKDVHCSLSE